MAAILNKFGGDPSVRDRGRVLRVAGTLNTKYEEKPEAAVVFTGKKHPWRVLKR